MCVHACMHAVAGGPGKGGRTADDRGWLVFEWPASLKIQVRIRIQMCKATWGPPEEADLDTDGPFHGSPVVMEGDHEDALAFLAFVPAQQEQ